MSEKSTSVYRLAAIGMMSAVAFVSNYLSIPIGDVTRIHFGNVFCVLSGLLLGPVGGGLSAGIGAFFYDLTNPLYADEALITFALKFMLAFLAGSFAHANGRRARVFSWNLTGAVTGSVVYVVMYLAKNVIKEYYFLRSPMEAVLIKLITRAGASAVNALIAVVVSMALFPILRNSLQQAGIFDRLFGPVKNTTT
jgi:uncharacterized membrane protein